MTRMFFRSYTLKADSFETQQLPKSIAIWLSKFFVTHKSFLPLIKVEDSKNMFSVDVFVENKQNQMEQPLSLHKVLTLSKFKTIKMEILYDLTLLTDYFPELTDYMSSA